MAPNLSKRHAILLPPPPPLGLALRTQGCPAQLTEACLILKGQQVLSRSEPHALLLRGRSSHRLANRAQFSGFTAEDTDLLPKKLEMRVQSNPL